MLTKEILESNVTGLTPEQIEALTTLSKKDEEAVISANRKEFWDAIDNDIYSVSGVQKPANMKTHDFLKTQLSEFKKKADEAGNTEEFKNQITQLEKERDELNEQIKSGKGNEMMKTQMMNLERKLKDKEDEILTIRESLERERDEFKGKYESAITGSLDLRTKNNINSGFSTSGLKFKDSIDKSVRERLLKIEMEDFLKETTREIEQTDQGEIIVFRDKDGKKRLNNKGLNPYSPFELFTQREGVKMLLDEGKPGQGGGGAPTPGGGNPTTLDLGEAATQKAGLKVIRNHIIQNEKIAKTDPKFAQRQEELVKENNLLELPVE